MDIINDLLDFSKIEANHLELENLPFEPRKELESVMSLLRPKVGHKLKDFTLESRMDPRVPEVLSGDALRLRQILLNLGGNALKFSERGTVRLAVELLEQSDVKARLAFIVSDEGIGMINSKKYSIAVIGGHQAFADLALPLYYSLRKLGYEPKILENALCDNSTNIIFGLCDCSEISLSKIPKDSIIYNLEQMVCGSKGVTPFYLDACSKFKVWDYSKENVRRFKENFNIDNVEYVPMGYCPEMSRLDHTYQKDIDVLMYGAINERRAELIGQLRAAGVNAVAFQGLFGIERDIMIARSKIVLNAHYYVPGIQEVVRLGYLWANKKCVVCERNPDTDIHDRGSDLQSQHKHLRGQIQNLAQHHWPDKQPSRRHQVK